MKSDMKSIILINNNIAKEEPLLTIAIPTYRRFDLLKETLRSVFELTFSINVEVIIVDNDPDNNELAIKSMTEFKGNNFIYYKNIENYGMFNNWNQALLLGKGKFITILHDDDLLKENFSAELEKTLAHYGNNIPLISFQYDTLDERHKDLMLDKPILDKFKIMVISNYRKLFFKYKKSINNITFKSLLRRNYFAGTLAVIFNRNKAIEIGGFEPSMYPSSDYEFWIRWSAGGNKIVLINQFVATYRIKENESMKAEVVNGFIETNYKIRLGYIKKFNNLRLGLSYIKLLKEFESISFNYMWGTKENRFSNYKYIKMYFLRLVLAIYQKVINIKA